MLSDLNFQDEGSWSYPRNGNTQGIKEIGSGNHDGEAAGKAANAEIAGATEAGTDDDPLSSLLVH